MSTILEFPAPKTAPKPVLVKEDIGDEARRLAAKLIADIDAFAVDNQAKIHLVMTCLGSPGNYDARVFRFGLNAKAAKGERTIVDRYIADRPHMTREEASAFRFDFDAALRARHYRQDGGVFQFVEGLYFADIDMIVTSIDDPAAAKPALPTANDDTPSIAAPAGGLRP